VVRQNDASCDMRCLRSGDGPAESRVAGAFPLSRHQSLKLSYAQGAYVRFGGDYRIVSAAWQYSWIDRPR
jgi:hypothetical protein